MTNRDDVILSEAQFIIIVSLKVQQSLCPSPPVAGHNKEVFMISLVALHGVVRSQVLERQGGRTRVKMKSKLNKMAMDIFDGITILNLRTKPFSLTN